MRIVKSGKLTVSLTCESASPGSGRFPRHANQQVREADGFPDMPISKSGKQVFPEKSGFCGKSSTPAHVRFFSKPFISLPQRSCASVGTARALGGYNKKSPTENLAAANAREVITRVRL